MLNFKLLKRHYLKILLIIFCYLIYTFFIETDIYMLNLTQNTNYSNGQVCVISNPPNDRYKIVEKIVCFLEEGNTKEFIEKAKKLNGKFDETKGVPFKVYEYFEFYSESFSVHRFEKYFQFFNNHDLWSEETSKYGLNIDYGFESYAISILEIENGKLIYFLYYPEGKKGNSKLHWEKIIFKNKVQVNLKQKPNINFKNYPDLKE